MKSSRRALPLSGAKIAQNLSVLRISLQTCEIDVQMVLLKMIEFLYFHKHHRTAEETIFKAEFLLLEIQNYAIDSNSVPTWTLKWSATNDQTFFAIIHSKNR